MAVKTLQGTGARARLRAYVDAYVENDLLTYASAISFQILSSLVPLGLFAFGLLGFLHLEGVWADDLGPRAQAAVSPTAFAFADDIVRRTLGDRQVFWITRRLRDRAVGALGRDPRRHGLAQPRLRHRDAAVVAAADGRLDRARARGRRVLAGRDRRRRRHAAALRRRSAAGSRLLLFLARWAAAGLLLLLAVALLLHYAPERRSPLHWVTFGAVAIMAGWLVMSLGFGLYLREIADYNSIFGGLATVVVLIAYLYAAAVVFLGGVQLDALVRR